MSIVRILPATPASVAQKAMASNRPTTAAPFPPRPSSRQLELPVPQVRQLARNVPSANRKDSVAGMPSGASQTSVQDRHGEDCRGLFIGLAFMDQQGEQGDGQDDSHAESGKIAEAHEAAVDVEELLDILPTGGDSGIFEVLLPGGEILGVVVDAHPVSASYLLSPSGDKLRSMLLGKKKELEQGLERRMHRSIGLTVL